MPERSCQALDEPLGDYRHAGLWTPHTNCPSNKRRLRVRLVADMIAG
jgi:hypothetical protein